MAESPLGHQVRTLRVEREMSQEDLARASDVSIGTISRIERGIIREPGAETLERIATTLGTTSRALLRAEAVPVTPAA